MAALTHATADVRKLFQGTSHADVYAKYRPTYPPELYGEIQAFMGPVERRVAVDIATGSGQAARDVSAFFPKVIALDASEAQVRKAPRIEHVEFMVGDAERTGLPDHSVELATVAQACTWRLGTEATCHSRLCLSVAVHL